MSLRTHIGCTITPTVGMDVNGRPLLGNSYTSRCAVVKLSGSSEPTSVRTDSSASRGAGREILADARLLFPQSVALSINDKVELLGFSLRVVSVRPRLAVGGRYDHNQVDLMVWA